MAMRDDPLPLASLAAELLARAAKQRHVQSDAEMAAILSDLELALPLLNLDEPHMLDWGRTIGAWDAARAAERAAEKAKARR